MKEPVDDALEAWARWASRALSVLGIPPANIIARVIRYGVLGAAAEVGLRLVEVDELCELVDRAVCRLNEKQREVIIRHYFKWEDRKVSAKACRMSYEAFANTLSAARRRVWDYLEGASTGLHNIENYETMSL